MRLKSELSVQTSSVEGTKRSSETAMLNQQAVYK